MPLPPRIVKLACNMFAGPDKGFSGWEIHEFFADYVDARLDCSSSEWRRSVMEQYLDMFDATTQVKILEDLCDYDGPMKYDPPSQEERDKLRQMIRSLITPLAASTAPVMVNWSYAQEEWDKALRRTEADPSGAITSARSLIETVCKHIMDEHGIAYERDIELQKLYKQTAKQLNLSPDSHNEDIFKQILGGCQRIADGMAGLRNNFGDSHGVGKRHYKPSPRHARLAVNVAGSLALFLMETHEARSADGPIGG